jgi:ATP-dependent helicase HrpA
VAAAAQIVDAAGDPPRDPAGYAALLETARIELRARTADVIGAVVRVMTLAHQVEAELDQVRGLAFAAAAADMREQLGGLIADGFIARAGARRLPDLLRYLRGISYRLERGPQDVRRDQERMDIVHRVRAEYERVLAGLGPERLAAVAPAAAAIRWQLEELRISVFAVSLGTSGTVSEQRVMAALERLRN